VPFSDNTIIYENKVSEQNVFPWLKDNVKSRSNQGQIKATGNICFTGPWSALQGLYSMPDEI
jgi:hypothetical protein